MTKLKRPELRINANSALHFIAPKVQVYKPVNTTPRALKPGEAGPRQYDSRKSVYKPSDYLVSATGLAKWTL